MQRTIYTCDNCHKEIGAKRHISLHFDNYSGIAAPPGSKEGAANGWSIVKRLAGKFTHFCNARCVGQYFVKYFALAKKK